MHRGQPRCIVFDMRKEITEFKKMTTKLGLQLLDLSVTGKSHYKARLEDTHGQQLSYVFPNTASDRRAAMNRERDLRRYFNIGDKK